jgi:hypothetical protein
MSSQTLSVEEYLASSFRSDCDYERNWGEWNHSEIQAELLAYLLGRYRKDGIRVMPELRIQVKPQRFRVTDLCVLLKYIWVLDPQTRKAFSATLTEGLREVTGGVLRTENPALEVPLGEIFR